MMRPVWNGSGFVPCKMMNLSSSFDHRVVDGWDAATFVQHIKGAAGNASTDLCERLTPCGRYRAGFW
jgi:2-oxoisovalerate dehydrogenase E2 component (dihydrolipoyl transacylase)